MLSSSAEETRKLAASLLKQLNNTSLICLYGPLGSGKTTFVQGLAQALRIKKIITSPTFVLLREYKIKNFQIPNSKFQILSHIDCYRIKKEGDFKSIGLEEMWSDPKNLVVIEWAERIKSALPKKRIDLEFKYLGKNKRQIKITNHQ